MFFTCSFYTGILYIFIFLFFKVYYFTKNGFKTVLFSIGKLKALQFIQTPGFFGLEFFL